MNTTKKSLTEIAAEKGYQVTRFKPGTFQYSPNGYEWTNVNCSKKEFVKIVESLPNLSK